MSLYRKYNFYRGYYLQGDLPEKSIQYMEAILRKGKIEKLKNIVPTVTLLDAQTVAVGMGYVNRRFIIGDKPGLGKTIMSSGVYILAKKKEPELTKKLLLVTISENLLSMTKEMRRYGINLVPLYGDRREMNKKTSSFDLSEVDGVAVSWRSMITNGFLDYYVEHMEEFSMVIFDESSAIKSATTQTFRTAKEIADNMNRVLMLNGSAFETHIMDIVNQFAVLNPSVFPTKNFINDNYVVYGKSGFFKSELGRDSEGNYTMKRVFKHTRVLADYKNQSDLRNRLRYHYIARSKKDYSDDIPKHIYRLIPVGITPQQRARLSIDNANFSVFLNSPTTSYKDEKFNMETVPKLAKTVDLFESIREETPIIYCLYLESQYKIAEELEKRGYKVGILNSKVSVERRQELMEEFNEGKIDTLIFNTKKAINLPRADSIILYNVPTNPQLTYQILGRIDRNNYTKSKSYYFMTYLDTKEIDNMINLALFRERHSNEFTGQVEEVYSQLISQFENISEERLREIQSEYDKDSEELYNRIMEEAKEEENYDVDLFEHDFDF